MCSTNVDRGHRPFRAGYTLLEMLLVLAVAGVILAVAWPNVMRLTGQQKLTESAEKVRNLVASARFHAIDSGLVYQFRYEPGGRSFVVVPFEREFEAVSPGAQQAATSGALGRFSKAAGTLPEGVVFAPPSLLDPNGSGTAATSTGLGQKLTGDILSGLPNASKLESVSWSGPLQFFPDGTAVDARFDLIDTRNQRITLQVRGVTGAINVSRIHQEERP
jgi:prepilin-type N-terminal cleavage/methylation domain-containing protein